LWRLELRKQAARLEQAKHLSVNSSANNMTNRERIIQLSARILSASKNLMEQQKNLVDVIAD
jgi:hypothetical protein